MLQTVAPFPYPGSIARVDGLNWRVHQHNQDGTATLMREGTGASFTRRHAIADLVDPTEDDLPADGLDRIGRAQLKWLRETLRTANAVVFSSLRADMAAAAHRGEVPIADGVTLAGLLRRLDFARNRHSAMPRTLSIWERTRKPAVAA